MRPPKDLPPATRGSAGFRHRSPDGRLCELGWVGPFAALLHVGKLVAQRGDAALSEFPCHSLHEGMEHSGPRAVREHVAGARLRRRQQQGGDGMGVINP
jgi:hypothetical protein